MVQCSVRWTLHSRVEPAVGGWQALCGVGLDTHDTPRTNVLSYKAVHKPGPTHRSVGLFWSDFPFGTKEQNIFGHLLLCTLASGTKEI